MQFMQVKFRQPNQRYFNAQLHITSGSASRQKQQKTQIHLRRINSNQMNRCLRVRKLFVYSRVFASLFF